MSQHFRRLLFKQVLLFDNDPDYIAEEYSAVPVKLDYIVSDNHLDDSVFTASSTLSYSNVPHAPEKARLDKYFDTPCCWAADSLNHCTRDIRGCESLN